MAALDAELEAAEAEAEEAEARADEAEQQLTSESAAILAKYAATHEGTAALEGELAATRAALDALRAENLALSRQSIELDRQDNACVAEIAEAVALLEKCSRSHGELDAEIEGRRTACEAVREEYRRHGERLEADLQRFAKIKARLLEVHDAAAPPGEADALLKENDALIASFRKDWEECQQVVRDGVRPRSTAPALAKEAARPRRWRTQQAADGAEASGEAAPPPALATAAAVAEEAEVESRGDARGLEAAAAGGKDLKDLEAW